MAINRIDRAFKDLQKSRSKALIGYITAGFPTKAALGKLVPLLEKSGADLLEIGIPFSDPIADGPTIQESSHVALKNGVTLEWVLKSVRTLRQGGVKIPLIFMSYCNPIQAMGIDIFFQRAKSCGVDGLIIPDMIPEEATLYTRSAQRHGIDLIFLAAPTSSRSRIRMIAQKTQGFLYAVSLTGVTGVQKAVAKDVSKFLQQIRSLCRKPIAIGFGLTTPQQVRAIAPYADGVIIGSALIRAIAQSKRSGFDGAARFVRSLKGALHAS